MTHCPSAIQTLEVIYNAALRMATGLPRWTPIPILRREAGASSMASRCSFLTGKFILRQLALPTSAVLGAHIREHYNCDSHRLARKAKEILEAYNINSDAIIRFAWPWPPYAIQNLSIISEGLPFQDISLPNDAILQNWLHWRSTSFSCHIIGTDASKDTNKTAVAAYNESDGTSIAMLVPHLNSIFTAEALALQLAITHFTTSFHEHVVLLSDSLSVIRALQGANTKSPRVILQLLSHLRRVTQNGCTVRLIWCPGHKGIGPNEHADHLARFGPYSTSPLHLIAPEDIASRLRSDWQTEIEYSWINCNYSSNLPFLTPNRRFSDWCLSRHDDVSIARWRSRSWPSNSLLHRLGLSSSPLCPWCCVSDTIDHLLLKCPVHSRARSSLFLRLGLVPPVSFADVIRAALGSRDCVLALARFSVAICR